MALSWNEIRSRALQFAQRWADETSEDAEAKPFWVEFFNVFGIDRKRVASFEAPVKKSEQRQGYIDLFWKGMLLIEHKSRGKSLDKAYAQALDYFPGIAERDLPKFILVSDFARFRLYDLERGTQQEFALSDLPQQVELFGFIAGYQTRILRPEDPVNIQAAELMGKLHDALKAIGYEGHPLEVYLVRLLFCLFAEDTGIFQRQQFKEYLELKTAEDGSDLAAHLAQLFQVLNTAHGKRLKNLDEHLAAFEYINGRLFAEPLPIASFDSRMRNQLLDCCALDWSRVSPAIFGSLFQSVMDKDARRNLGAHYTSESNILKLIKPLFLDELQAEFDKVKHQPKRLSEFHDKLRRLKFFDPACGCGNFLVIAYRELRQLELEVLRELYKKRETGFLDVSEIVWLDVDQFYGIEIEEFPAAIAQVAMWLTDHQMNQKISAEFGNYFARLPLKKSASIVHGNALRLDWNEVLPAAQCSYIMGNPPFIGKHYQSKIQKGELLAVFDGVKNASDLDYVAAWYLKAAQYMAVSSGTRTAFVSTNSITQGEQVSILWGELLNRYRNKILFAHRTFKWGNDARGKAAVHCVIVGFSPFASEGDKSLYVYDKVAGEPHELRVKNISPYLTEGGDVLVVKRQTALANVPVMRCGNKPSDGGFLLMSAAEREALLAKEPAAAPYIKQFLGADEFLNGSPRYCLWLNDIAPSVLRSLSQVLQRVEKVREFRLASTAEPTRRAASVPSQFFFISQPQNNYILIPEVSSERREYVPIGFMPPEVISSNKNYLIAEPSLYLFGMLQSSMHMAWIRHVAGRLKSDFQYSASMVYNTFPWPEIPPSPPFAKGGEVSLRGDGVEEGVRSSNGVLPNNQPGHSLPPFEKGGAGGISAAAQAVLDARALFPAATLADLYDPLSMPPELRKAHEKLDKAVDAAYGKKGFASETERVAFLFERYQQLTSLLPLADKPRKRKAAPSGEK